MPNGNPGKVTAVSGGHWQKEHLSAPGALVSKLPLPPPPPPVPGVWDVMSPAPVTPLPKAQQRSPRESEQADRAGGSAGRSPLTRDL